MAADEIANEVAPPVAPASDATSAPPAEHSASTSAPGKSAAPSGPDESVRMSDVALEVAKDIVGGRKPGEGASKTPGKAPPTEKPTAKAPAEQPIDPVAALEELAKNPNPEAIRNVALGIKHYQDQANAYIASISEQAAVAIRERSELAQRITRLYEDPTFRQAFDHFVKLKQSGATGTQLPAGPARLPSLENCETDTERALVTMLHQQAAEVQGLRKEMAGLRGGQERFEQHTEAQQTQQFQSMVKQLHVELDKKYPSLATPEQYEKWHALAARLWDPINPVEGQSDLTTAMEQAAQLLTHKEAAQRGAAEAAAAARKVARTQTVPEGRLAASTILDGTDEDTPMHVIAERMKSGGLVPAAA